MDNVQVDDIGAWTRNIMDQNGHMNFGDFQRYELSLLLNSFKGLLVSSDVSVLEGLPESRISYEKWGIAPSYI
ncbi:MAG: hypothetical protein PQJ58_18160, partial [Spirochaetales bacterium]|nr:hypothetical protein [Spirochaetales bacterium]